LKKEGFTYGTLKRVLQFWTLKALNYDLKSTGERRNLQMHELEELKMQA